MSEKQWKQVKAQLPKGSEVLRFYNAAENGQLRVIAKAPTDQWEMRYNVSLDEDGNAKLEKF